MQNKKVLKLTIQEPLTKERRFLQTGSSISMQLKLRTAALDLARGRDTCKTQYEIAVGSILNGI